MATPGLTAIKTCTKCGESLPLSQFAKAKSNKDGLRSWCKPCGNKNGREHRMANPYSTVCNAARFRSKKNGLDFNLTPEYLKSIDRDECPYLEIPIKFSPGGRGMGRTYIDAKSLDRIRPELGYVEGNVVFCSQGANLLLSDYAAQDFLAIPMLHRVGINFLRLLNSTQPTNEN